MGDRGNIAIKEDSESPAIYLYTHWSGSEVQETLRNALAKRLRWTDGPYLTRIIFDELTGGEVGETGYGISTYICDNEHAIPVVNVAEQTVTIESRTQSFDEFVGTK